MLKGRKQSDTYLATFCRHHWSVQMTMKKNIKWSFQPAQWLSSAESSILYLIFSPGSLCYSDVYRCKSGRCGSLPFLTFFYLACSESEICFRIESNSFSYLLARTLIFSRIKQALGLDRCLTCLSGAAPISVDVKKYFLSIDIPLMDVRSFMLKAN